MDRDTITRTGARTPGVGGVSTSWRCIIEPHGPDTERDCRSDQEVHEGRMQTEPQSAHAGSGLKLIGAREGAA
jgi:hypothetical protein